MKNECQLCSRRIEGKELLQNVILEGQSLEEPINEINITIYAENIKGNEWVKSNGFKCTEYNQDKEEKTRQEEKKVKKDN